MAHRVTPTELRKMPLEELLKEIDEKRLLVAKMRLDVRMRTEKDTAKYRREKRAFAALLTILGEKRLSEFSQLKKEASPSTVPTPARLAGKQRARATSSNAA